MNILTRAVGDVLVVDLDGRLDTQTSVPASDQLMGIAKSGHRKVLLNLDRLEYVSSAGLRVILQSAKLLQAADGEMKLCRANGLVKEVLEISGFISLLRVYDAEQDACADF
jgi:anti-anti-sigma factor